MEPSLRVPEEEVQAYAADVPILWSAGGAMLSSIICVEHEDVLVRPLDTGCVPLLIPRILWPGMLVVEHFGRSIETKTVAAKNEVMFGHHHVAIGCQILPLYPTKLGPVPVTN